MRGFVAYEGPSVLDGQPIVAVVTLETKNAKTGNMAQLWIMRGDVEPHQAVKTGEDASVCGACPQRQHIGGACYVITHQGPLSVYRAWKRGTYSTDLQRFVQAMQGRRIRLGAYGDPAAVPYGILQRLVDASVGHTGYTHQMRHANFDWRVADLCMVSADTPKQAAAVAELGYRTFRVKTPESDLLPGEMPCPTEYDPSVSCATCGACNGATRKASSVTINVHGSMAGRYVAKYGRINVATVA